MSNNNNNQRRLVDMGTEEELNSGTSTEQIESSQKETMEDDLTKPFSSVASEILSKSQIKNNKIQVSIYLDEDVHKKYMRYGRKVTKGGRSELVNDLLRKALNEY